MMFIIAAPRLQPLRRLQAVRGGVPGGRHRARRRLQVLGLYDHNDREFMSGFSDFTEAIADSDGHQELRDRVSLSESASMWQSLAYGPTTRPRTAWRWAPREKTCSAPSSKTAPPSSSS